MAMKSQAQLLEIVVAGGAAGTFPCLLNCRQQETDQDADNGDHH